MNGVLRTLTTALAGVGLLGSTLGTPTQACTSFTLKGNDGGHVYGRTMEFGQPLNSEAVLIQRGTPLRGNGPNGGIGNGLAWTSRYAVVGMNALGLKDVVPDGMNEKGLAGGLLYFAGYADFQTVPAGQTKRSINSAQLLTYALTNFATIEEVKQGLPKILVNGAAVKAFGGPLPIHMTLHDSSGKSLSVEYIQGELTMMDNPTGTYTNDPPFPYHLAMAGNYANLSAMPPAELTINGLKLPPTSTGGGRLPAAGSV
jgi:choloylglycine hydrolase